MTSSWSPASWASSKIALHPGQGAVEQRARRCAPGRQPTPANLSPPGDGEVPAERLLVLGQDVDAERPGGGDAGPARGALPRGQGHQRRVERQRRERLAGEADGLAVLHGGDDRDPGGEMAEHLAEARRRRTSPRRLAARSSPSPTLEPVPLSHAIASPRRPRALVSCPSSSARSWPEVRGGRGRSSILPWRPSTPSRRPASRSPGPRPSRRSMSSSVCRGSWWNSASCRAPASAATWTA